MLALLPLPAILSSAAGEVRVRRAAGADVPAVVALLADDPVSASRGDLADPRDAGAVEQAFAEVDADPRNALLVGVLAEEVVATLQLTTIPGLARRGATRLQVEAVHVRSDLRSSGIGGALLRWVVDVAPVLGADLVQLTSDACRADAHRFYERLGFAPTHVGFKLPIPR